MANVNFSTADNGYSPEEVDRYVEMLQQEYSNAVAWSEEMESKYEQLKAQMQQGGIYFTIDEDNQNEVIDKVFAELSETVAIVKKEADQKANAIIERATEKSRSIIKQAMESSVELRTQNSLVLKNLKSISEMIDVIVDKSSKI